MLSMPDNEREEAIKSLLDGFVRGELRSSDNLPENVKTFKIGDYCGREYSYSAIYPETGERGLRFTKVISRDRNILFFYCIFLKNTRESYEEKNVFFYSLKYNRKKQSAVLNEK